jgi:SEC-C motif-containing protein
VTKGKKSDRQTDDFCPCGSGRGYPDCCGRLLEQGQRAESAERLMRSRYTAYVLMREGYLLRTWHASTRPATLDLADAGPVRWLDLKIVRTEAGGATDHEGVVEFVARYKVNGKAGRLHETSRFISEDGQWLYVDGAVAPS